MTEGEWCSVRLRMEYDNDGFVVEKLAVDDWSLRLK
jgi:hypothetical protein